LDVPETGRNAGTLPEVEDETGGARFDATETVDCHRRNEIRVSKGERLKERRNLVDVGRIYSPHPTLSTPGRAEQSTPPRTVSQKKARTSQSTIRKARYRRKIDLPAQSPHCSMLFYRSRKESKDVRLAKFERISR
jgi:hypothetical protein